MKAPKDSSDVARQTEYLPGDKSCPFSGELLITEAHWRAGCSPHGSDSGLANMITFQLPLDAVHTFQVLWEQHLLLLAGLKRPASQHQSLPQALTAH